MYIHNSMSTLMYVYVLDFSDIDRNVLKFFSFSHTLAQKHSCKFVKLNALIAIPFHPAPCVQCNHASACAYLMHIWISAEWLIIKTMHYGRTICRCFHKMTLLCRWIIGSSYILFCSTKLHCTGLCLEVISPGTCRGRDSRYQKIHQCDFSKCGKWREKEQFIKILCDYRE